MAIATHHDEIGSCVGAMGQNCIGHIELAGNDLLEVHLKTVAGEVVSDVSPRDLVGFPRLAGYYQDLNFFGAREERHGIGCGTSSVAAAVPAHGDVFEL